MANGGHFLLGGAAAILFHFENGLGLGRFAVPPTAVSPALRHADPHNESLDQIWIGGSTGGTIYFALEWDGSVWTRHEFGAPDYGQVYLSRVPGTNIVFAACDRASSGWRSLFKYTGVWVELDRSAVNDGPQCPLAISADEFLYTSRLAGIHGGVCLFRWTTGGGIVQYGSAIDLPDEGFNGICQLGDEFFLFGATTGNVYRGTWSGGFVIDNATHGPFTVATVSPAIATSADGLFVVVQASNTEYWIRNGPDDWTNVGPQSTTGTSATPAAIDRQTLVAGGTSSWRLSLDGGTTWYTPVGAGGYATCALMDPVSSSKRLLALLTVDAALYSLSWRGDAKYSPWARWSNYRADIAAVSAFAVGYTCIQGFPDGKVVVGVTGGAADAGLWHYDPTGDVWTRYPNSVTTRWPQRIHGTEYAVGKIHAIGELPANELWYYRWNGAGYDEIAIVGSSAAANLNIQASTDGQHVWVGSGSSQLWHTSDGGTSWTNRFAAAAAVHADPGTVVKDVWVFSTTEVWIVIESAGGGLRFSKFNGSSWSIAAPDINEAAAKRCLHFGGDEAWWVFTSNDGAAGSNAYKLVAGAWISQQHWAGLQQPTGIESFSSNSTMALCTETAPSNLVKLNDAALGLGWQDVVASGLQLLPSAWPWADMSKNEEEPEPDPGGGGDLAGGPRFRVGFDPDRRSGPRQEDGSLQSDLLISTGVQNIAQFDGGTMED